MHVKSFLRSGYLCFKHNIHQSQFSEPFFWKETIQKFPNSEKNYNFDFRWELDPLLPVVDPRILIHIKIKWIRNTGFLLRGLGCFTLPPSS